MVILILITLFVVGLCLGSFVNAFIWRHYQTAQLREEAQNIKNTHTKKKGNGHPGKLHALEDKRAKLSILKGRSMCTHCGHQLQARDLIPVVSYLQLKGKCRYCGKKIEDSPLSELLTPLLFIVSYLFWPVDLQGSQIIIFGFWLVFLVGFVALALYDRRWYLLPHTIVLPLIGLAVVQSIVLAIIGPQGWTVIWQALLGALVIGGLFYLLYRVSNEKWIGGGDVTLGIVLGLLAGSASRALLLVFIASLLGTLVAIPLIVTKKAGRNTRLPFGPFLMLAAIIVVLFGRAILDWYIGHFLTI
jgi:prepilin signal peptidase PulO-like enzyme (type II secretory pathway)